MRILKNALLALFILALMTVAVSAEAPETIEVDCSEYLYQEGSLYMPEVTAAGVNEIETAKKIILEGLRNCASKIDLTGTGLYYSTDIKPAFSAVINENPELFYATGKYTASGYRDSATGDLYNVKLTPEYSMPVSDIPAAKVEFQAAIDRIVAYASTAATPLMKALMVNDYFCVNYHYDTSKTHHDAYSLLVNKTGVCQSYMLGYKAVLKAMGIPVKSVTSDPMNHAWNLVQIDGEWYHVDVTWDDPVDDRLGRARHCYFMRSDNGFTNNVYANKHYSWVAEDGQTATSTRFDAAPWCEVDVPVVVFGDGYYCIRGYAPGEIVAVRGNQQDVVHTFQTMWRITTPGSNSYYDKCFSAFGSYRNYLLYTTHDSVRAYSLADGSVKTLYTAPSGLGIWAGFFDGGVLHYALGQKYNEFTEYGDLILDLGGVTPVGDLMILPEQTEVVEAQAFRNSKIRNLVCNEDLKRIESMAFADCADLETAEFGDSVAYIADDAFSGSENVVFICPTGSYAAKYAAAHGFATDLF